MRNFVKFLALITMIGSAWVLTVGPDTAQETFSCSYGKQASCLDYGDKVCSSYSKCVSQDAKCFDSYTCGYDGFICKSKYDDVVDEYNDLLRENQRLISKYNSLLNEHRENVNDYNSLLSKHSDLESCVSYADSLEAAKRCAW